MVYAYPDGREAAFDIHTSWVTPDNFPGYVEQEVQFRFDNGVWNAHQRKRGVEVDRRGPNARRVQDTRRTTITTARFWSRGANAASAATVLEVIRRFFEEVAYVEFGGPPDGRGERLRQMSALAYNDLSADRQRVAAVQAMEAILRRHADGRPGCVVDGQRAGRRAGAVGAGRGGADVLYEPAV